MGLTGRAVENYVKAVSKAELRQKGYEDVFRKISHDFDAKGVKLTDQELRNKINDFLAQAVGEIEAESKSK